MKIIAPNSCMYCEITHDKHGTRGDGLHPRGMWTWVEPSDKLRLERMKRNRKIRKGISMNIYGPHDPQDLIGKTVVYCGNTRASLLGGKQLEIIDARTDGRAVAVQGPKGVEWIGINSVEIIQPTVTDVKISNNDIDNFLNPHSRTIAALDSEISRLQDRINELRAARQTISAL